MTREVLALALARCGLSLGLPQREQFLSPDPHPHCSGPRQDELIAGWQRGAERGGKQLGDESSGAAAWLWREPQAERGVLAAGLLPATTGTGSASAAWVSNPDLPAARFSFTMTRCQK